jgi:hypothetical protein
VRSLALGWVLVAGALAGCASRTVYQFHTSPRVSGEPLVAEGLAVFAFEDGRSKHPLNHNLKNLALIPLIPFAVSYRDLPERTAFDDSKNLNGFEPTVDLARSFAAEIEVLGIFASCRFHESAPGGSGAHGVRYELRGTLRDSHVSEGYLTYGVSVASILLHVLGLPEGTLRCALRFDVELFDRRTATVVWKKTAHATATRLTWIYSSNEADSLCGMFSDLANETIRPAVAEMRASLHEP